MIRKTTVTRVDLVLDYRLKVERVHLTNNKEESAKESSEECSIQASIDSTKY